jgi:Mn2+/Fe2+ NRAMP family transporter
MALTWLGAGDLVDSAVAGGEYGYALTWAMPVAFVVRFVFASILAKLAQGEAVITRC